MERLFEGQVDYPLAQLRKADSHCRGTLWYQTELGHSGQRIRLQTVELAFARQPEIYASVPPQLERPERGQRLLLYPLRRLGGQLRGKLLSCHARRVLALVVVDLVFRDDLS